MKVNLKGQTYEIVFGSITNLPKLVRKFGNRFVIITDTTVGKKNKGMLNNFQKHGLKTHLLTVKPGEKSKQRKVKQKLEDKILKLGCGRDTVVIALGGGVVGDLAGFVAATLHRGVAFVQVPTTLLAQIDSSIGGKVAVNHPLGKNLIGAFHQPSLVLIDINTLKTLPRKEIRNGLIEVIKHALILDSKLFDFIEDNIDKIINLDDNVLEEVIKKNIEIKKKVVENDEKEGNLRKILNFGHTIGHALELDLKLTHGEAVGLGIIAESKISVKSGLLSLEEFNRINSLIKKIQLTKLPKNTNIKKIIKNTELDKKSINKIPRFILLRKIGEAKLNLIVPNRIISKILSEMK